MEVFQALIEFLKGNIPETYFYFRSNILDAIHGAPIFLAMAGGILLLQKYRPANASQPIFSVSLFNDFLWFWATWWLIVYITNPFHRFLQFDVFQTFFATFSLTTFLTTPIAAQIVIAILAQDFIRWFHHWARHKVPLFWQFHAVHHSQTEMTFLSDYRVHPVDRLFSTLAGFVPFGILLPIGIAVPTAVVWGFILGWHQNLYHSNVRMNFGILRYVFVTPQSHRVHHSILPEHRDTNFGVLFCFWDRLFGTHKEVGDEYPPTGIPDTSFPMETSLNPVVLVRTFVMQWLYPFYTSYQLLFNKGFKKTQAN